MATNYTTNVRLQKPSTADRQWDVPLNANADYLDGLAAIGGLAVTPLEIPSASLSCRISSGTYIKADGSLGTFAGASPFTLAAGVTSCVWLTDAGIPGSGTAFPTIPHLRLAQIQTGPASIMRIIDARMVYRSVSSSAVYVAKAGDTMSGPLQVASPTTGISVLSLDPTNQLIGFFGAAAAMQAPRLNPLTDSTGGTASDGLSNVGTTFSQATLNNNFASISAKVDTLIAALKRHGLMST